MWKKNARLQLVTTIVKGELTEAETKTKTTKQNRSKQTNKQLDILVHVTKVY